jgi:hypothetical protein
MGGEKHVQAATVGGIAVQYAEATAVDLPFKWAEKKGNFQPLEERFSLTPPFREHLARVSGEAVTRRMALHQSVAFHLTLREARRYMSDC